MPAPSSGTCGGLDSSAPVWLVSDHGYRKEEDREEAAANNGWKTCRRGHNTGYGCLPGLVWPGGTEDQRSSLELTEPGDDESPGVTAAAYFFSTISINAPAPEPTTAASYIISAFAGGC